MEAALVWGIMAVLVSLACQLPLIRGVRQGTCTPHAFSYAIWSVLTGVGFAAALAGGGGHGAWAFGVTTLVCITITCWALREGDRSFTRFDWWCLLAAAVGLLAWPLAGPGAALAVVISVDLVGYAPTLRKAWGSPYSEPVALWLGNSVKHLFGILALAELSVLTLAYPLTLVAANAMLALLLFIRRHSSPSLPAGTLPAQRGISAGRGLGLSVSSEEPAQIFSR